MATLYRVLQRHHPCFVDLLRWRVASREEFARLIRRDEEPDVPFYLDPPYCGCETDYGAGVFAPDDSRHLVDQLAAMKGRLVLSINATPGAREVIGWFKVEEVEMTYKFGMATGGDGKRVTELGAQGGG